MTVEEIRDAVGEMIKKINVGTTDQNVDGVKNALLTLIAFTTTEIAVQLAEMNKRQSMEAK